MALWHGLIPKLHQPDGDPELDLDPCRHALHADYDYDDVGQSDVESASMAVCRPSMSPVTAWPVHRRPQGKSPRHAVDAAFIFDRQLLIYYVQTHKIGNYASVSMHLPSTSIVHTHNFIRLNTGNAISIKSEKLNSEHLSNKQVEYVLQYRHALCFLRLTI